MLLGMTLAAQANETFQFVKEAAPATDTLVLLAAKDYLPEDAALQNAAQPESFTGKKDRVYSTLLLPPPIKTTSGVILFGAGHPSQLNQANVALLGTELEYLKKQRRSSDHPCCVSCPLRNLLHGPFGVNPSHEGMGQPNSRLIAIACNTSTATAISITTNCQGWVIRPRATISVVAPAGGWSILNKTRKKQVSPSDSAAEVMWAKSTAASSVGGRSINPDTLKARYPHSSAIACPRMDARGEEAAARGAK